MLLFSFLQIDQIYNVSHYFNLNIIRCYQEIAKHLNCSNQLCENIRHFKEEKIRRIWYFLKPSNCCWQVNGIWELLVWLKNPVKYAGFVPFDRFPAAFYDGPFCPVLSYFLLVRMKIFSLSWLFSEIRAVYLPFNQKPLHIWATLTKRQHCKEIVTFFSILICVTIFDLMISCQKKQNRFEERKNFALIWKNIPFF